MEMDRSEVRGREMTMTFAEKLVRMKKVVDHLATGVQVLPDGTKWHSAELVAFLEQVGQRNQMLVKTIEDLEEHLDWIGWGDSYERSCAKELQEKLARVNEEIKR